MVISLFPKNTKFFELLETFAALLSRSGSLLAEAFENPYAVKDFADQIHNLEHDGDKCTRELLHLLIRSFITPFERSDIHTIATCLDDILDAIDETVTFLSHLQPISVDPDVKEQVKFLDQATSKISDAINRLRYPNKRGEALDIIRQIGRLEGEGDAVYNRLIASLFLGGHSPNSVLRSKMLSDHVEEALNACQRLGNSLELAILKLG